MVNQYKDDIQYHTERVLDHEEMAYYARSDAEYEYELAIKNSNDIDVLKEILNAAQEFASMTNQDSNAA